MPFRTIRDLGDEIAPDYFLAIDEIDRKAVLDTEGDAVFFLPPSLGFNIHAAQLDQILIEMAAIITMARNQGWERGSMAGARGVRDELQKLLGIDRVADALERLADQGLRI